MPIDRDLAERVVEYLNEIRKLDPRAVHALVEDGVACNKDLAQHFSVQVRECGPGYVLGLLGIMNGLCGIDAEGWGAVAGVYDDDTGALLRFIVRD